MATTLQTQPGKTSVTSPAKCSLKFATMRAAILVGCFRKADAGDPEIYTAAVVAVLSRYPVEVAAAVTEPATGLPSRLKWLPSIAEITEACEDRMPGVAPAYHAPVMLPPPMDRSERPSLDELKAKYGPNWGLKTV